MTWFTLFYPCRKCRNHPIGDLNDEAKINDTHESNDRTNSQHIICNDSDWMNAIKADAKLGLDGDRATVDNYHCAGQLAIRFHVCRFPRKQTDSQE